MKGICKKCGKFKHLTRHHLLPQRWWQGRGRIKRLCRDCHNKIELLIPFQKMPVRFYFQVFRYFIREY